MLFDGDCPLCMREVNMLRRRDEGKGRIDFVNIGDPGKPQCACVACSRSLARARLTCSACVTDYSPADNAGISYEQAMGAQHEAICARCVACQLLMRSACRQHPCHYQGRRRDH